MIPLSQWFFTSSALILAILVLRAAFSKKLSLALRYALWAVVLVRLLFPFSPLTSSVSLSAITQPIQQRAESKMLYAIPTRTYSGDYSTGDTPEFNRTEHSLYVNINGSSVEYASYLSGGSVTYQDQRTDYFFLMPADELLTLIWKAGIFVCAIWMLQRNVQLSAALRQRRTLYPVENCPVPVYLVSDGLPAPCLFGLFRPAIYLTGDAAADEVTLRHVLAHELTHYAHRDHIWSFLRCVCLALHWYNPLVWTAAVLSRRDGELACDEGAVKRLGDGERISYGRTLLGMVARRSQHPGDLLTCSTAMAEGKKPIQQRIQLLVNRPKTKGTALFLAISFSILAMICVFSQGNTIDSNTTPPSSSTQEPVPLSQEELAFFNTGNFFDHGDFPSGVNIRNQLLTSFYDDPRDINLHELFYCGSGQSSLDAEQRQQIYNVILESTSPPDTACTIVTRAEMDAVLTEHMGISLEETNKVGLEYMDYLPEYDAYYNFHGDTNYGQMIYFTSGLRSGNTIWLYYQDNFGLLGGGPCVLTLYQDGERYYFRANQSAANSDTAGKDFTGNDAAAPDAPTDDISDLIRSAVSFHFAQGPFSSYIGPTVTDPVLVEQAIQIILSGDPYNSTVQHGTPEDGSILTLYGDFGNSVNELALPISNQTMCEELLVLEKLQDRRLQLAQALSSDTYRQVVPLLSEKILSDPHWAEMQAQLWNYDQAEYNLWLEEQLTHLGFDPYFNLKENLWFLGERDTSERISLSGAFLSYDAVLRRTASPVGLSVPSAANDDKTVINFGDSLAHHYLNLDPRHPNAVTSARLLGFEIFERSDNQIYASISLALTPVEPHTVFWMSGAGIDLIEDGPYAGEWKFTLEYRLELQSDGSWVCTETATGGLRAE